MAIEKKRPLQSSSAYNAAASAASDAAMAAAGAGKSIEETYQKKTQLEHILLRPDTYIGSVERHSQALWVYENDQMVHRTVTYVPGLYKIFDEILVNAADNKQRDPSMDSLKVEIDQSEGRISVYNNGDGIPVEIHKEEGVYVPELIFGHLLTSSNYNDDIKKTTGGRNGYGAKLTNIFSTDFVVETADGKRQKKYKQVFSNNMNSKGQPIITKCKDGENWTRITFKPDLPKFNMSELEDDVVALMKKRVVDLAGTLGKTVKVELNGQRVPVKTFQQYVDLYLKSADKNRPDPLPRIYEANDRWEICFSLSEGQFQQVSFVNRIATIKGGSHVEYITNQITNHVTAIVHKKNKTANLKPHMVKNHVWVFVNALIDNPAFDSQTKETLTTRQGSFGSKCELSPSFLKKVAESGIVDTLLSWADFKLSKDLKKTDGTKRQRLVGLTKLEDANEAGGKNSEKCTLILTEGDSAKALAMAGISVVGRDFYGVFPLRGKLLNVREASPKQIMENTEIQNIKQILGLQHGKKYDSVKSLRYGHLMIMTDQDHDGSHIKGLLINFIHSFWPSLLKIPSFMVEFITPIVKATKKGNKRETEVLSFYSMPDYEQWKETLGEGVKSWKIKYYKGLGTSDSVEGREYFSNLDRHKKDFVWADEEEDGNAIELAFSKKKIEERKNWLRQFEPGTCLDQRQKHIKYSEFVNKELILFSMADLQRSIPSMVDGLKPGQRKILFCSLKKKLVEDIKVSQFCGYVSEHSAYHHGEQSLATTIQGMANDFVGSNNINLLVPSGQFGTRLRGGKDAAHARYIFTRLSSVTRFIFHKDDDTLLDYLNEDGQVIEPTWYVPIIPMVLVNGSEGIGTGWSSFVPNYNPRDIIANLRRLLNGEEMEPMIPWYKGFEGLIERTSSREAGVTYTISGVIEEVDSTTLRITELPVRRWTQDYKEFLESLVTGSEKIKPFIKDYRQYSDDRTVNFEVYLSEENLIAAREEGLLKKFKLTTSICTSNMHLFDSNGVIKKYDDPEQIVQEFFHLRLAFYEKRKAALLAMLAADLLKLDNRVKFILGVVNGEIKVFKRKIAELLLELQQRGFSPLPSKPKTADSAPDTPPAGEDEEGGEAGQVSGGELRKAYAYLLTIPVESFTLEMVDKLLAQKAKLEGEVEELSGAPVKSIWLKDLEALDAALDAFEKDREEELEMAKLREKKGGAARHAPTKAAAAKPRRKAGEAAAKPKAAAAPKKAPSKRATVKEEDDEDEEILDLKERLARYDINSPPEDVATSTVNGGERMEEDEAPEDEDYDLEEAKGKKKAAAAPKKPRGRPVSAKKPAQLGPNKVSPEKKVRKIRPSPFNKKSGSVLGRAQIVTSDSSSGDSSPEEVAPARPRPQRANRAPAPAKTYLVLSDSDSEEEDVPEEDDSDFNADD